MITMTFREFHEGNFDEDKEDFELYVLKRQSEVLYIGVSSSGIWDRWFGSHRSHMVRTIYNEWFSTSEAGRAVVDHAPESGKWIIELWTLEDCRQFLNSPNAPLRHVEKLMINHLHPSLNSMSAPYHKSIFE